MELTTQTETNLLLESIDLYTKGIIWIPGQQANGNDSLVNELDYFFDGTISSGIHHHGMVQDFSLFSTTNFGKDLKLAMISNNNQLHQSLDIFMGLVSVETGPFKIILIQNKINKDIEKTIEKKLSKFKNASLQKIYC